MFILSLLARYAYRRPEPDLELTSLCNGVVARKQNNPVDEANAYIVSSGYYNSLDTDLVTMEKEDI